MGDVRTKTGLLFAGSTFIGLALIFLGVVATMFWPFQSVVQVIAPFLAVSIFASVGISLLFTALLVPRSGTGESSSSETASVLDSLLSETNRRR